jgi:murein endopeptidase
VGLALLAVALLAVSTAVGSASRGGDAAFRQIEWRHSKAVGEPWDGKLVRGVRLPREGEHFFTWDPATERVPNEPWRRWGTDRLLRKLLRVIRAYSAEHPNAPRVGVGDISRRHGGDFGPEYGGLGHSSHQNGLDVDVYYPRTDRREWAPMRPRQVDHRLAQDLVDRFVDAGAQYVFVGPNVDLHGPAGVVQELRHHNDHLHFRIYNRGERR